MSFLSLENKNMVVSGLANKKSIAYFTGRLLLQEKAQVAFIVHTEKNREEALKLFPGTPVFVCDVADEKQIQATASAVAKIFPKVDGLLHSIAFANYSEGPKPFHETHKEDFLQAIDISCFSLTAMANAFKDQFSEEASVVALSISTTTMASENYGYMAPIKAALDSTLCFLAKSFSHFSKVRFNGIKAGLLKTKSSAGIPDYVKSYLYAEELTLRKKALQTNEVAQAAVFLLSPASSGINAGSITLDAGMSVNYFDKNLLDRAMRVD